MQLEPLRSGSCGRVLSLVATAKQSKTGSPPKKMKVERGGVE